MFNFDKLGDEEGILLTKFTTWADVVTGDVLARHWNPLYPTPVGWTQNGSWIFRTHDSGKVGPIRPDIRARKV